MCGEGQGDGSSLERAGGALTLYTAPRIALHRDSHVCTWLHGKQQNGGGGGALHSCWCGVAP